MSATGYKYDIDPEEFSLLLSHSRKHLHRRRRWSAEWQVPKGPLGLIVVGIRARARRAETRALWVLGALILSVVAGLFFYIALPIFQENAQSQAGFYQERIDSAEADGLKIDADRNALRDEVAERIAWIWVPRDSGVTESLYDLGIAPDGKTMVALGEGGTVTRSADGGESWQAVDSGVRSTLENLRIAPDGKTMVAVGWGGAVARSTDSGETWQARDSGVTGTLRDLRIAPDGKTMVAVGRVGTVTRSTNGGETWQPGDSGVTPGLYDLRIAPNGKTLVAVGDGGAVTRSTDGGETWQPGNSGLTATLFDLLIAPDGKTMVAVGGGGRVTRSTDGGESWQPGNSDVTRRLSHLRIAPDGKTLVAVGWGGAVTRSSDGGESWQARDSGVTGTLRDLRIAPDGKTMVAVGGVGAITHSADGGDTWQAERTGVIDDLWDLQIALDSEAMVAAGDDGTIIQRTTEIAEAVRLAETDEALRAAMDAIPTYEQNTDEIERLIRLEERRARQQLALAEWQGKLTEARDKLVGLSEVSPPAASAGTNWTHFLIERLPGVLLLLFLLATLGALYRHNLRMAGFHYARADALELMEQDAFRDPGTFKEDDGEPARTDPTLRYAALVEALGAEKVEFARGRAPIDAVVELAKDAKAKLG